MYKEQVAVVILNWNGWRHTVACLESLTRLNYTNLLVLVVDNASTDDSVHQILVAHPEVKLLRNSHNLGFGGGNNPGINFALAAEIAYVWLLNNDTLVYPGSLQPLIDEAEGDAEIGAVASVLHDIKPPHALQVWGGSTLNLWTGLEKPVKSSTHRQPDFLTAASVLLRASALKSIGIFDERFFMYWEDADLGMRLRNSGWRLAVSAGSKVLHQEHASTEANIRKGKGNPRLAYLYQQSAVLFLILHAPFPYVPIVISFVLRVTKRLFLRDPKTAWSLLRGTISGLHKYMFSKKISSS